MHSLMYTELYSSVSCAGLHVMSALLSPDKSEKKYKKLSYCWETVRRESMPRIAEINVEMTK